MLGQFSYAKVAENMNMVKREMEDVKNNSSLQSLGKSNMTTVFLRSGGASVGECSCTTCCQHSLWLWERSRPGLSARGTADVCWSGARTGEQDQLRNGGKLNGLSKRTSSVEVPCHYLWSSCSYRTSDNFYD